MKCLTGNLPSQLECSSTGRKSVCLTEATHPRLKRSAEMGETRNSSWYLKQCSLKSSSWTTCKWSSRPVELRNSKRMLISPANFLSPFFSPVLLWSSELSYLFYIAAELEMAYQEEEMALPQHYLIHVGWIPVWSIPSLVNANWNGNPLGEFY